MVGDSRYREKTFIIDKNFQNQEKNFGIHKNISESKKKKKKKNEINKKITESRKKKIKIKKNISESRNNLLQESRKIFPIECFHNIFA